MSADGEYMRAHVCAQADRHVRKCLRAYLGKHLLRFELRYTRASLRDRGYAQGKALESISTDPS